jgi:O-antigen/teichoic acid export membrane protein
LSRNVVSTFGATGAVLFLSLVTSVLLARSLGPDGRGALLALTFWPALLSGLFSLSVNEATAYHVARAGALEGEVGLRRYASSGLVLQIVIAFAAATLTALIVQLALPDSRRASLTAVVCYAAAFTPLMLLDQHFRGVLQGRGAFGRLNAVRMVQPLAYCVGLVALALTNALSVGAVMATMVAALAASCASGAACAGVAVSGASVPAMKESLVTGSKFHAANVVLWAAAEADKPILLHLMDDVGLGYYAVASAVSAVGAGLVVQSLGMLLARDMAAATAREARIGVFVRNIRLAGPLLALVNGAAAALAPWWLPAVFGAEFAGAVPVAMVLLLMGAIKGLRQIIDRAMRAMRVTRVGIAGQAAALAGLVVFAPCGLGVSGLVGFAWGLVAAQLCSLVLMLIMAGRCLGLGAPELLPKWPAGIAAPANRRELRRIRGWRSLRADAPERFQA